MVRHFWKFGLLSALGAFLWCYAPQSVQAQTVSTAGDNCSQDIETLSGALRINQQRVEQLQNYINEVRQQLDAMEACANSQKVYSPHYSRTHTNGTVVTADANGCVPVTEFKGETGSNGQPASTTCPDHP